MGLQVGFFVGFILCITGAATFLAKSAVEKSEAEEFDPGEAPDPIGKICMAAVSHFQTVGFIAGFDFEWPDAIANILDTFSTTSGGSSAVVSPQCLYAGSVLPAAYANFLYSTLLPFIIVVVLGSILVGVHHAKSDWEHFKSRLMMISVFIFFFFQPSVVKESLVLFSCQPVGEESRLYASLDIDCRAPSHLNWMNFAGVSLFISSVVMPSFVFWRMWLEKDEIRRGEEDALRRWGFLANNLERQFFYWDLLVMTRKVLIASAVTLAKPSGVTLQALLCLFVFVIALSAHMTAFPYTHDALDVIESAAIGGFLITVWLGITMSSAGISSSAKQVMSVLIVTVNIAFVGVVITLLVLAWREKRAMQMHRLQVNSNSHPHPKVNRTHVQIKI